MSDVKIECDTGVEDYVDARDIHPDYQEMECWNCGHTERVGPNQRMRVCHHCFMDNNPTDHDGSCVVEGPDGDLYTDYRQLWYGDVSVEVAQELYEKRTQEVSESARRSRALDREVNL